MRTSVAFERESFETLHEMLSSLSDAEKEETWREVLEALRPNEHESGFAITGEMLVAAATAWSAQEIAQPTELRYRPPASKPFITQMSPSWG